MIKDCIDKVVYMFMIFILIYNRVDMFECLFDSIVRQGFCDFEWFVVDDGLIDYILVLIEWFFVDVGFLICYFW